MATRILIFSIAMGAHYSFYVKTIETHARTFFKVIIFSIGSVIGDQISLGPSFFLRAQILQGPKKSGAHMR